MSETQIGPDWWFASDGRWYPPDSTSGGFKKAHHSNFLPNLAVTASVVAAAAGLAAFVSAMADVRAISRNKPGKLSDQSVEFFAARDVAIDLKVLAVVLSLVFVIVALVLCYRTCRLIDHMLIPDRFWSRCWVVGAWFIPVVNLVVPFLSFGEVSRILQASDGQESPQWREQRAPTSLWIWGGLVIGSQLLFVASRGLFPDARSWNHWSSVVAFLCLAGALLAATYFLRALRLSYATSE